MVGEKIGGHVLGAYDGSTLVAFAFGLPGVREGHTFLHSHMLAVKETLRNSGIGARDEVVSARACDEPGSI